MKFRDFVVAFALLIAVLLDGAARANVGDDRNKDGSGKIIRSHAARQSSRRVSSNRQLRLNQYGYAIPSKSLHFMIITVGSRGDVQYFIPICVKLVEIGHRCTLGTHARFREWITKDYPLIGYVEIAGDPEKLLETCVDKGMFSLGFMKDFAGGFLGRFVQDMFDSVVAAVTPDVDMLISSPSVMASYHVAEWRDIPYVSVFSMPVTPASSYSHPFVNIPLEWAFQHFGNFGYTLNRLTYGMTNGVWYLGVRGMIDSLRRRLNLTPLKTWKAHRGYWADGLGMPRKVGESTYEDGITTIYPLAPELIPRDPSWRSNVHVTGFIFLKQKHTYKPSDELKEFLDRTNDTRPIVYVGFGSMVVQNGKELTQRIIAAAFHAEVRLVIAKGWMDATSGGHNRTISDDYRHVLQQFIGLSGGYSRGCEKAMYRTYHFVKEVPHDWLFEHVDAVVHHGGMGTTAAGLHAGKPTLIVPFFGDQFMWAKRIQAIKVGTWVPSNEGNIDEEKFQEGLELIAFNMKIRRNAERVQEAIAKRDGLKALITETARAYRKFGDWRNRTRLI